MPAPPISQYSFATGLTLPSYPLDGLATSGSQYAAYPGVIMPMGTAGAGVGICPENKLPPGFVPMFSSTNRYSPFFGNYKTPDGSVMVFRPKYYYKVGTGGNGLAVNVIDIKGIDTYSTTTLANAAGYALCRSFIDGGVEVCGKFDDKYMCSANIYAGRVLGSSIKNGRILSSNVANAPVGILSVCGGSNTAADFIRAATDRNNYTYCMSVFDYTSIARIAMAHGQACSTTQFAAWYDATYNFPKGCNNNALADFNDGTVTFTGSGYTTCPLAGSGTPFEKTTHNGQTCGVCDINGGVLTMTIGMTCLVPQVNISAMTQANPCQITTATPHGMTGTGELLLNGINGMTQPNNYIFNWTYVDSTNIILTGIDSSGWSPYTSGGTVYFYVPYIAKQSVKMRNFTYGNTLATDHFGATGIASMMQSIFIPYLIGTAQGSSVNLGTGATQVFAEDISGDNWLRTCAGLTSNAGAYGAGTNLFGLDTQAQYIQAEMMMCKGGSWNSTTAAGCNNTNFGGTRTLSDPGIGYRCSAAALI
jgi:hypothetical protein